MKNFVEFITDSLNKKSSKRLAGFVCIGTSLIIALFVIIANIIGLYIDTELVEITINPLLTAGTVLLGAGVIEKFNFKSKTGKDDSNAR